MMQIEVALTADERTRLSGLFGAENVDRIVQIVASAGVQEALDYATGTAVFSTMSDLRSYRVYCLLRAGMTLDEAEVLLPKLFKLSTSGVRRIVSAAYARYEIELSETARGSIEATLNAAMYDDDAERWVLFLPVGLVRDRLLELTRNSSQPDPERKFGATYHVPDETYQWLRSHFGFPAKPVGGK